MQPDTIPHSADVDAYWTMSLFMDVYIKTKIDVSTKGSQEDSNEIIGFNNLYRNWNNFRVFIYTIVVLFQFINKLCHIRNDSYCILNI